MAKSKRRKPAEPVVSKESPLFIAHLALLYAAVFLAPLLAGRFYPAPAFAVQALVIAAALVRLVDLGRRGSVELPGGRWPIYLSAFFLLLMLSAVGSTSLSATVRELANIGGYLLLFLMAASLKDNRKALYGVPAALCLSALLVGALGLREYLLSPGAIWRVFSTFFNPDYLAGFAALMLPVALAWYLSRTSFGISAVAGLAVLSIFGALLMTGSRLGFVAASGGLAVFVLLAALSRSIGREQLLRLAAIAIPVVLVFFMTARPLTNRMAASSVKAESHSGGFRILTWKGAARMAASNPVNGTGLNTFEIAYPPYALVGYTKMAHNSYLQIAGEAGIPAAGALLVALCSLGFPAAYGLARRRVTVGDSEQGGEFVWMPDGRLIASGLLAGAAASVARNMVDSDWYVTAVGGSFWAVTGAAVALAYPVSRQVRLTGGRVKAAVALPGIMLAGVLLMLSAELHLSRGLSAMENMDPDTAISSYKTAARLDFLNPEPRRRLGMLYLAMGDHHSAEEHLRSATRLEPASAKNYYLLSRIREAAGRVEDTISALEEARKRDPQSPKVLLRLADEYEKAGRTDDVPAVFRRMVEIENSPYDQVRAIPELVDPEYVFAHAALGKALEEKGDRDGAAREYGAALDRIERYQASQTGMAQILEVGNRRDTGMEDRVEALRVRLEERMEALTAGGTGR